MSTIHVSAFRWVPPVAQGYVRDLRVRWALEEAGLPYEAALVDPTILASPGYRAGNPFGQGPAYRDDSVELFESGAIVLHIAAKSAALAPRGEARLRRRGGGAASHVSRERAFVAAPATSLLSPAPARRASAPASWRRCGTGCGCPARR